EQADKEFSNFAHTVFTKAYSGRGERIKALMNTIKRDFGKSVQIVLTIVSTPKSTEPKPNESTALVPVAEVPVSKLPTKKWELNRNDLRFLRAAGILVD